MIIPSCAQSRTSWAISGSAMDRPARTAEWQAKVATTACIRASNEDVVPHSSKSSRMPCTIPATSPIRRIAGTARTANDIDRARDCRAHVERMTRQLVRLRSLPAGRTYPYPVAVGRVGTGLYSDKLGRANAYLINGVLAAACILAIPWIMAHKSVPLLFVAVGVIYWQYGGGLALLPAFTADYFGSKNLGFNYGLVFLGWGIAFFIPQLAGYLEDYYGTLDYAFYLSAGLLIAAVIVCRLMKRPVDA